MIDFVLNNRNICTDAPPGGVVLDFLRKSQRLAGVREGCREGACGACLVLVGEIDGRSVSYRSMNSCLLPLAEIEGKHVVTIEGLDNRNDKAPNPIQQVIVDEGATQCGYCTPGIILALAGLFLETPHFDEERAIAAVSGNICRCTGYQSIKRAAIRLCDAFPASDFGTGKALMERLVEKGILPSYFLQIPERLRRLPVPDEPSMEIPPGSIVVGGGTALWGPEDTRLPHSKLIYLSRHRELKGIRIDGERCYIGAATTFEEIQDSSIMQRLFPRIRDYFKLIASKPIRHRITVGGNIADAVPYADAAVFFLATGASVVLRNGQGRREVELKDFFKGYRQPDKESSEFVEAIRFPAPTENMLFNFENISKRPHLDISSVNSAAQITMNTMNNGVMERVHLSAGGVAPVPIYLSGASGYLTGKTPEPDTVREAAAIAQTESSPISDVRGSAEYKRLLLRQLIYAHFITLFPERITLEGLR
uniref:Xanthine dehydrogenase small subunit n=1 Tax=Candidatus Kentrum sp. FM TaxID=2126340 RepID=A0A450S4N0_9GAMM|nr:MAG: xanthine dehydrogenase small subunit [Candidatus Kentron sp. FM]VFJ47781.1 MAG: xanthine dehydrogenase small subunit [Candidatus Kentron sp. FM]VFK07954.1 MAG: xanthine dehydrogenase small subunit [Candidatus Kentron sp. FM]